MTPEHIRQIAIAVEAGSGCRARCALDDQR